MGNSVVRKNKNGKVISSGNLVSKFNKIVFLGSNNWWYGSCDNRGEILRTLHKIMLNIHNNIYDYDKPKEIVVFGLDGTHFGYCVESYINKEILIHDTTNVVFEFDGR